MQVYNVTLNNNTTAQLGSLPDVIRPTCTVSDNRAGIGILATNDNNNPYIGYLYANTDGTLTAWAPHSGQYSGQLTYLSATE